ESGLEILLDREQWKDLAPLRHIGDAAPRPLVGLEPGDVRALPPNAAAAHRVLADERAQQARLADAVAAEHAGDLAGDGLQRHRAQRLRGAVVQIDGFDVEHAFYRPR